MKINFKYRILITSLLILVLLSGAAIYYFLMNEPEKEIREPCLANNEFADYYPHLPVVLKPVTISVKDKNTNQEKFSFQVENIRETYYTVQLRKCGVYILRFFNYDPKKSKQSQEFRSEFWKYQYNGQGERLFLAGDFSYDFRTDPNENYIVLEKGYLGQDDYALVVKNLETKEDVFVLQLKEIVDKHPSLEGSIGFNEWTKDGRYFWGDIFDGAYIKGFFKIDTSKWKVDVFEAPEGVGGGDALNIEKGLVTRHPGYVWTGLDILTEEIKKEWREQGKKSTLYLYNLFTKEQVFLETTDEPLWFFKPRWLSDTELEYTLLSGERKIYKIND